MKRMPKVDVRDVRTKLCELLYRSHDLPSKQRRAELLNAIRDWEDLDNHGGITVNRRNSPNIIKDRDLAWLIKNNKLSVHREKGYFHARYSYTVIKVVR